MILRKENWIKEMPSADLWDGCGTGTHLGGSATASPRFLSQDQNQSQPKFYNPRPIAPGEFRRRSRT
jgi:hypothetical protein